MASRSKSQPTWTAVKAKLASFDRKGFSSDIGHQDEGYFDALIRMFEQALTVTDQLPASDRNTLIARLDRVRAVSHNLGYGVGDYMDSLLAKYVRA